jgi:Glycosyltransferase
MSFGKPVFISKLTSLPEIGGNAAFYFSSFDESHIQHAYHQGMSRYQNEDMADLIKKRSQDFSWEKSARDYVRVYQSLF